MLPLTLITRDANKTIICKEFFCAYWDINTVENGGITDEGLKICR